MRVLSILLVFFVTIKIGAAEEPVRLTTKIWEPYQYREQNSDILIGVSVQVVKCSFNKINVPFVVEVLPWKRAQVYVQHKRADGFFSASWSAERDQYAIRSENIANQTWKWYYLKESEKTPKDASFKKNAIVGATLGSNIEAWLLKNDYQLETGAIDAANLLNMLVHKRIDAFIGNEFVVDKVLNEFPKKNQIENLTARNMPVGIYFSKEFLNMRPDFLNKINAAIVECRLPIY